MAKLEPVVAELKIDTSQFRKGLLDLAADLTAAAGRATTGYVSDDVRVRAMAHALTKNKYGTSSTDGADASNVVHDYDMALDWLDGDATKPWILPDGSGLKGE